MARRSSGCAEHPAHDDACKELGTPIITEEHLTKIIDVVDNNDDGKFSVDELSSIIKPILKKQLG